MNSRSLKICIFVLLIAISFIGCGQQKYGWKGAIEIKDGVTLAQNQAEPMFVRDDFQVEEAIVSQSLDSPSEKLLNKFGWTIKDRRNSYQLELPSDLLHAAGEYPIKIFWAYNLELSKSVGLDFSPYLGQEVGIEIYNIKGRLPDFIGSHRSAWGVIVSNGEKIIGAFITLFRGYWACSLDRKSMESLTGKNWDEWIDDYIDYGDEIEISLSTLKPEEVIAKWLEARNSHDVRLSMACLTRRQLCLYLVRNTDSRFLYDKDFPKDPLKSVRLIKIEEELVKKYKRYPPGVVEYKVRGEFYWTHSMANQNAQDGINTWNVTLKKETLRGGWRIRSMGVG